MVAKVEEYSESHRAMGLPDDLLNILKDDLEKQGRWREIVGPSAYRN
jgi:protein associated with RNAse G/E